VVVLVVVEDELLVVSVVVLEANDFAVPEDTV
jgi:hypothetical protein